jgi:hypothetical protein
MASIHQKTKNGTWYITGVHMGNIGLMVSGPRS